VGSDLEAQLIEARLIREQTPEVNIQTQVHRRDSPSRVPRRLVAVLPSADPECVELFLLSEESPLRQLRGRRDLRGWNPIRAEIREFFFESGVEESLSGGEEADLILVRRYLSRHRDAVRMVDVNTVAGQKDLIQKIQQEVRDLEPCVP
jgi:hypothetical protein